MKRRFEIGGVAFDLVERSTLERELYVAAWARRGRLDQLRQQPDEDGNQYARRLYQTLTRSEALLPLVASQITPAGLPWSCETAAAAARHVAKIHADKDKTTVNEILGLVVDELLRTDVIGRWDGRGELDMTGGDL